MPVPRKNSTIWRARRGDSKQSLAIWYNGLMQADLTLTVDGARPGPRLSPILHGIFFEEINHAGDGGLYPEKLRNRNFAEGTKYWEAVEELRWRKEKRFSVTPRSSPLSDDMNFRSDR